MDGDQSVGELVRRARDGDDAAWDALVTEFSPTIWSVARSYRLSEADAADAHAMTWVRLIDNIHKIREPDRIAGWLSRTAANEALAIIRKDARSDTLEPEHFDRRGSQAPDVDHDLLAGEAITLMRRALRNISEPCQQLLRLLYGEPRLSYEQVAEMLGHPVGSIGPTRQRCLERVRSEISALDAARA